MEQQRSQNQYLQPALLMYRIVSNQMNQFRLSLLASAVLLSTSVAADSSAQDFEIIEVRGELLPTAIHNATNAIEVLDKEVLEQYSYAHIQDALQQIGNVNFSSGSSRARFFQIRGIGERSQFVDPVNPSVGVAIDGIDYTGMANAATLFDVEQVEVFKGPQGTSIGANAMAGFINLTSTATGSEAVNKATLEVGNYGLTNFGLAYGDDISEHTAYRVSVNKLDGDGYIENAHLGRDDTNGFDELSVRAVLDHQASADWAFKAVFHKFDIDNGYDTFSLDLNRTTLSDNPGFDRQDTTSFALTTYYSGFNAVDVKVFVSKTDSDLDYGYDEDWAFEGIHPYGYSSVDHYFRERDANQIDVNVTSKDQDWVIGVYRQNKETDLTRQYTYLSNNFGSNYDVSNTALYGEKRVQLNDSVALSAGVRVERYDGDYTDNNSVSDNSAETMWGGHLTLSNQFTDQVLGYVRLSRGFKAGGVNGEALARQNEAGLERFRSELLSNASFEAETLNNLELGLRYVEGDLVASANVFYADRDNMQVKQWITNDQEVQNSGEAPVFVGFISNAPSGTNYGFESNIAYQVNQDVEVNASFAMLETEVKDMYRLGKDPVTGDDRRESIDGRDQAHAPGYQFSLGTSWQLTETLQFNATITGRDDYLYSFSHDEKSDSVQLLNASLVYQGDLFDLTLWARNLTDQDYGVRGFYFGNDPRDGYQAKNYEQFGEPRTFGIRLDYVF